MPSVIAGEPYVIIGNGGSIHDFSTVEFPQDIRSCDKCHDGAGADGLRYAENPSLEACGSCHNLTWFGPAADLPAGWTAHVGNQQANSALCTGCHPATGGLSPIIDRHFLPREVPGAPTLAATIVDVTASAGAPPVVTFELHDRAGTAITSTSALAALSFLAAGPTTEYSGMVRNFGIEGYRNGVLRDGTTFRHGTVNPVAYAELTGGVAEERRAVVDNAKCSACHGELALHGTTATARFSTASCAICRARPMRRDVRSEHRLSSRSTSRS